MTRQGLRKSVGRGLKMVGTGIAWFLALLAAAAVVVAAVGTGSSWFYAAWFWGALALIAALATVSYGVRRPPRLEVAGLPIHLAGVIALRCALNVAGVAALGHVVRDLSIHAHDLPFWLLIEAFLAPGLFIGWGVESAAVETALLTPWSRERLAHGWRRVPAVAIVSLVSAVYWVCAASLAVSVGLLTSGRLPGWADWVLAWLAGAVFGLVMANVFVGLPRIRPLFEAAEVNGATGERLSPVDLLIRYTFFALVVGTSLPGLAAARHHHGLPPLLPPHWLVWLPAALALSMAAASLLGRRARDSGEAGPSGGKAG